MKKLNAAIERFALTHPNFGIPNLMRYIVAGNVIVFFLIRLSNYAAVNFLCFEWGQVLRGEIWRLVTFVFVPDTGNPFNLLLSLYFMYFIGTMLEREWGTPKFNLYYLSGVLLSILCCVVSYYVYRSSVMAGAYYVTMSMFLAFAALYPDAQLLLLYIIPVKAKWLAALDLVLFGVDVLSALFQGDFLGALLPVVALLNFVIFFWYEITELLGRRRQMARHKNSHQVIQFKEAARQQQKRAKERGYRRKCEICGRTDTEWPDLEFRYCSRCAGYHCFCQDHIYNHEHFRE